MNIPDAVCRLRIGQRGRGRDGWLHLDSHASADIAATIPPLPKAVTERKWQVVEAIHVWEHFYKWEAERLAASIYQLLVADGELIIECPNLEIACRSLLGQYKDSPQYHLHALYGDPGHRDPAYGHRWGYTPESLKRQLIDYGGFDPQDVAIEPARQHVADRDFRIVARKRPAFPDSQINHPGKKIMSAPGYDVFYESVRQAFATLVDGPSQYKWLAYPERFLQQSRQCVGLAGVRTGETIYDIGCGPGYLLWICRERLGCRVEGCDPLRGAPIYKELHDALKLSQCVAAHVSSVADPLPPDAASYDVIFATWITWIGFGNLSPDELARYIGGCMERLRPGGRLLLRFEESRFEEATYASVLTARGRRVAPFCYLFRKPNSDRD